MFHSLGYDVASHVATITLDRPQTLNAIDLQMPEEAQDQGYSPERLLATSSLRAKRQASAHPSHMAEVELGGEIHCPVRHVGKQQATGMLLAAKRVSAVEGLRSGFVNAIAAPADLPDLVPRHIGGKGWMQARV